MSVAGDVTAAAIARALAGGVAIKAPNDKMATRQVFNKSRLFLNLIC
jgi:hypothetical protein